MYKDAEDADGDIPEGVTVEEREERKDIIERAKDGEDKTISVDVGERIPREFCIPRKDAETLNQDTRGCPGCNRWFKGRKCRITSSAERYSRD